MSLRNSPFIALDINDTYTGAATVRNYDVLLPQDADLIVVKAWNGETSNGITGTSPLVQVYVQTTDDGGTTWYDCANVGPFSDTDSSSFRSPRSPRISAIPAAKGSDFRAFGSANTPFSVVGGSAVGAITTGLPLLGQLLRIKLQYQGTTATNGGLRIQVICPTVANNS